MRRTLLALVAITVLGTALTPTADAQSQSVKSDNMTLAGNWHLPDGDYQGSDLAFWGDRMVSGMYSGPGGFGLFDISNPVRPQVESLFNCPGTQADVSIWEDLVIMSVDSARGGPNPERCGAPAASQNENEAGTAWEGLRIVSIANPKNPVQIGTVKTDCGSHTHTLVPEPEKNRLIAYVLSYPLGAPQPNCNVATHRKVSIVEIPLSAPATAKVIGTMSVSPSIGCHDLGVFVPRKIAGVACISESLIWDISDPAKPTILSRIANAENNIHHSVAFSWDGRTMILGDELGGAAAAPGCTGSPDRYGGLWFYDVADAKAPDEKGFFKLPQRYQYDLCTAHLFNVVPLRSERDILVSSWYQAGTTVVDFTDPSKPKQIAFYNAQDPVGPGVTDNASNTWASYWYNGNVFANNHVARGIDIFRVNDPAFDAEIPLTRLNPQIQEPLPAVRTTAGGLRAIDLPAGEAAPIRGEEGASRCTSRRRFSIRLRAPKGHRLRSAVIFVNGRRVKSVKSRRALRRPVRITKLPGGRARVDVTLRTTRRGKTRRISRTRTYRFC